MKRIIYIIVLTLNLSFAKAQPYAITAYIDSSVITQNDVSSLQIVTYAGQGINWIFDRRVDDWTFINTYLFDVVYDDAITSQVQVNPEFGSIAAATLEAKKYAFIIGQLPASLRIGVNKIWIHQGVESFGGGFNAVLIHTGQSAVYEGLGILEEVLIHEATHTSLDSTHATSSGWLNAQSSDVEFISTYAASSPSVEDLAESFLTWIMVKQCNRRISVADSVTISQSIPHRLAYLDNQNFNMYPICIDFNTVGVNNIENLNHDISLYPNPTTEQFNIKSNTSLIGTAYVVYSPIGKIVITGKITNENTTVILSEMPAGTYLISIGESVKQTFKIIKQ